MCHLLLPAALAIAVVAYLAAPSATVVGTPLDARCEGFDGDASRALSTLIAVHDEVTQRQLGDALFRLHRARKNCRLGWVSLAILDYGALLEGRFGRQR